MSKTKDELVDELQTAARMSAASVEVCQLMEDAAEFIKLESMIANCTKPTWRCFCCDEVFRDFDEASKHFGEDESTGPACRLDELKGGLLAMLREAQAELRRYREEETPMIREVYKLGAEHFELMRCTEERGYGKGLADHADIMRSLHAKLVKLDDRSLSGKLRRCLACDQSGYDIDTLHASNCCLRGYD